MKAFLAFFLALPLIAFAAEKYGVYDSKGNRLSTFEVKAYDELLEKTRQIKSDYPNKIVYVSSMQKGKGSKPASRYRFKAEAGAYIEAARKETFTICPSKEIEGTWISEHSVYLNAENCLSVQAPNLAGTFHILFLESNGKTDTIHVLVDQSYIQMGDYSHKVWVTELKYDRCYSDDVCVIGPWWDSEDEKNWRYESRNYTQPLIVDKTKFTMGDTKYYFKTKGIIILSSLEMEHYKEEYKNEKLEESMLPIIGIGEYYEWEVANERSKKEGLDTVYAMIPIKDARKFRDAGKLVFHEQDYHKDFSDSALVLALDTLASGYRAPFDDEWFFLMRAGASTRYYWGDEEDSKTVSRYEWINPIHLKPVAKLQPNRFGLYDMMGIAKEYCINTGSTDNYLSPERSFIKKIGAFYEYLEEPSTECELEKGKTGWKCAKGQKPVLKTKPANYESFRLLRKTPRLQKLEKF